MIRFVLDESSWSRAAEHVERFPVAVEVLVERMNVASERGEVVAKHPDFYELGIGDQQNLFSVLFEPDSGPLSLDRDLALRLQLALDRTDSFDDAQLSSYDVVIAQTAGPVSCFAPGVAWAHVCRGQRRSVAVLPLPVDAGLRGEHDVTLGGVTHGVHFVSGEAEHRTFFRDAMVVERAEEAAFAELARSAFPSLQWADGVWSGLRNFSRPFRAVRDELIRYLGALDDHGAQVFHERQSSDPGQLAGAISAIVGTSTTDENGSAKRYAPARKDRTRRHEGVEKVFWWHVKLRPDRDRIYFLYEPARGGADEPPQGRIVIGLFKEHGLLPS